MKLVAFLGVAYVGVVAMLFFAQDWLLFPGTGLPSERLDRPRAPERLTLPGDDGATLHGMLLRAPDEAADLLIGFGGNAQDAEMLAQDLAVDFPELHTVVFHYRGYGPSTGRPGEAALLADALAIHDALTERLRPARTYAIGISLGSALAAWLSLQRRLAGVLLVTPFDSIEAVAKQSSFWVPVGALLRHRFASIEFMAGNATPAAVIAAEQDRVVRPARTQALVESLPNLVFYRVLAGAAHNTLYQLPAYGEALKDALAALRAAAET
jgi:pimeloyl-ACP methyl ester carboxylesterase